MKSFPLITAHTGCMGTPENSLESVRKGLLFGADIIEDDIRITRDGTLVLSHDDQVALTGGRTGKLSAMTISELDDRMAAPLVRLETALRIVKEAGKRMNLDIKADECLEPVFALIDRLDMADQVFLSGCEYSRAVKADGYGRRIPKLLNVDADSFRCLPYADAARQACEEGRNAGCFGLNVPYRLVRPELLELADRQRLSVYVWTIQDEEEMKRFAGMGVQSITTKDILALQSVKAEWNKQRSGR